MLKENCKAGMKVTTTGNPSSGERDKSPCCLEENKIGYLTIKNDDYTRTLVKTLSGTHSVYFGYGQLHPYWGDK
jgi:hypothetical protein